MQHCVSPQLMFNHVRMQKCRFWLALTRQSGGSTASQMSTQEWLGYIQIFYMPKSIVYNGKLRIGLACDCRAPMITGVTLPEQGRTSGGRRNRPGRSCQSSATDLPLLRRARWSLIRHYDPDSKSQGVRWFQFAAHYFS